MITGSTGFSYNNTLIRIFYIYNGHSMTEGLLAFWPVWPSQYQSQKYFDTLGCKIKHRLRIALLLWKQVNKVDLTTLQSELKSSTLLQKGSVTTDELILERHLIDDWDEFKDGCQLGIIKNTADVYISWSVQCWTHCSPLTNFVCGGGGVERQSCRTHFKQQVSMWNTAPPKPQKFDFTVTWPSVHHTILYTTFY